jgi:hypothetical protein
MNWMDYWLQKNGYVTSRAEYQFNKAGHTAVIGLAGYALTPLALTTCLLVAAVGYWLAGYTALGDSRHGAPTFTHGLAKLLIGLLPAMLSVQDWRIVLGWMACYSLVVGWRL